MFESWYSEVPGVEVGEQNKEHSHFTKWLIWQVGYPDASQLPPGFHLVLLPLARPMYSMLWTGVQHCPEWGLCPQSLHWRELGFQETDWATFWVAGDQQATLFFSVTQGWVLLRRHRTGKGVPLHVSQWFQLKLFSCIIILLTWIFLGVGVELSSLKHQGHKGHTREITSLVLSEWLRG